MLEAEGHTHDVTMAGIPVHSMEEGEVVNERPMSPTEEEAMTNPKSEEVVETKDEKSLKKSRKKSLTKTLRF